VDDADHQTVMEVDSGGSSNQTLWGQLVDTVGPSHISYSKILLVSSKPVGPGGPTAIACICHWRWSMLGGQHAGVVEIALHPEAELH
jgi:hypothetical protein